MIQWVWKTDQLGMWGYSRLGQATKICRTFQSFRREIVFCEVARVGGRDGSGGGLQEKFIRIFEVYVALDYDEMDVEIIIMLGPVISWMSKKLSVSCRCVMRILNN